METENTIDISKLDKAEVLAALYNHAKPQGMGFLRYRPEDMTKEEAQKLLDENKGSLYVDYLYGRVMKIDLNNDILEPWLYDRDNGRGAAKKALANLKPKT